MPNIGSVTLGSIPRVVLAVGEYSDSLKDAYNAGVSILEVRIDLFQKMEVGYIRQQLEQYKKIGLPLMATLRPKSEGGKWEGAETKRKELLLESISFVDAVDIELTATEINSEISKVFKNSEKTLIVSNHSFGETPSNDRLAAHISAAKALGADIVKLACLSEGQEDVARLMTFVEAHRNEGVVGISMGSTGAISRVVAPLFGSLLTYTSLDLNYGQLPLKDLVHFLRVLFPAFNDDFINTRQIIEMA